VRRFIILPIALNALCHCQDLTNRKPEAPPPIIVKVEMPPQNAWIRLAELAIPTVLGAGLTLFGVWLTNKHNTATNDANRSHDLEKLNREHSFGLRREVLMRVTQSIVQTLAALNECEKAQSYLEYLDANCEGTPDQMESARKDIADSWAEFRRNKAESDETVAAASLAVSDKLWKSANTLGESIDDASTQVVIRASTITEILERLHKEMLNLTQVARTELGIGQTDSRN
jgi:hypothetical protein